MATKSNVDDNMFDEKLLAKKIAEEEDLLTRVQMDLADKQDLKKKIAANIRTTTHKIKAMEEEITRDAIVVENLKKNKEKFVAKVDSKVVNKQIDKKCEEIFTGLLQTIDPADMRIEVEFESQKTTFNISDHRINNHYGAQDDESFKGSIRDGSYMHGSYMHGSVLSTDTNLVKAPKKNFICRTFGEMKNDVAAFFSLSADNFFFADPQGAIYLDELPIRPTLFPFSQKIKKTLPQLRIILINNVKYDDLIMLKVREQIGDTDVVDNTQQRLEQKEVYEIEQAKKKADQKRKSACEYYQFKKKVYKWKGFFSSLLYVVLIVLWLANVFSNFDYDSTYTMRNSTETVFQSYTAPNSATFYQQLVNQFTSTNPSDQAYGFVHFNYLMPGAEVVCKRFKPANCTYATAYMNKYYPRVEGSCMDPTQVDKDPYTINGVTFYYDEDPDKKVRLPVLQGSFDNTGYRLAIDYNDSNMRQKIADFVDAFFAEFSSLSFILYNPSLEKMACVYRMVYRYNRDKTTVENYSYIFNVRKQSSASLAIQELVLVIASILVLNSIFDMIDFVPASKVDLDVDLVWIRKNKKVGAAKSEASVRHKQKFKMIKIGGTVLKFYAPSVVNLLNLLSVVLNVIVVGLDIAKHKTIDKIDFTTGNGINCPSLIEGKTVIEVLYVIIIMLMMIVLLRYISQYVHFLNNFILIIQSLVRNTASLGILIIWLLLTITLFGVYTFGSFFPDLDNFAYMYTALPLLLMKRNIILGSQDDITYFSRMSKNTGPGALIALIIFSYLLFSFLIIKVITSIVIKSIKEAEGNQRSEELEEEKLREESFTFIREKAYEEYRSSQIKQNGKAHKETEKLEESNTKKKK